MELARVLSNNQITIPAGIIDKLNLKEGDKILFLEENNKIVIINASLAALKDIQEEMNGAAIRTDLYNEEDVCKLVKEIRKEIWETKHANNG